MLDELNNEDTVKAEEAVLVEEKIEDKEDAVEITVNADVIVEAPKSEESQALAPVENGVLGSTKVTKTASKPKSKIDKVVADDNVAVFSTSNVTWNGVGKVYRGINIVTAEAAEKWLERSHIRIATPQEVAKEYGL
jgi:hypothetical protein